MIKSTPTEDLEWFTTGEDYNRCKSTNKSGIADSLIKIYKMFSFYLSTNDEALKGVLSESIKDNLKEAMVQSVKEEVATVVE